MDKTILTLVIISAFVAGTVATVAIVSAQGDTIIACVNNNSQGKDLRIVDSADECKKNETPLEWNIQGPQGEQGIQGEPGADGATGPAGPGADPQAIIDLQNRVTFLETRINFQPIVALGDDQTNQGERGGPRGFQCAGDDAFNLGSGISDDGKIFPLVVTWTLNSAGGFLWSVDGTVVLPGGSEVGTSSVITFSGSLNAEGRQTSNWTVSAFDGEFTIEDTINLTCTA